MLTDNQENIGEFTEVEYGNHFTYRKIHPMHTWAINQGCTHEVEVADGSIRFAIVKKTVAYVVVDEAPDGTAVFDKWQIKRHVIYANS
jgi:hypothetical protein